MEIVQISTHYLALHGEIKCKELQTLLNAAYVCFVLLQQVL
jgi:hypothetical protein